MSMKDTIFDISQVKSAKPLNASELNNMRFDERHTILSPEVLGQSNEQAEENQD